MGLFLPAVSPALDANGNPISGAVWQFTLAGTTTGATVYSDSALITSLGSTVTADAAGRFVNIYTSDEQSLRARLWSSGAMTGTPIKDLDPFNSTEVAADDGVSVLDYIPSALHAAILAGTSTTNVSTYVASALAAVPSGGGQLLFPAGQYQLDTGLTVSVSGTKILARGATIVGGHTGSNPLFTVTGDDVTFEGGRYELPTGSPYFASIEGERCTIRDATIYRDVSVSTGSVMIYWRYGADGAKFLFNRVFSSHGVEIRASEFTAIGNSMICVQSGGDDCFAIKAGAAASDGPTVNHRYVGNYVEGHAAIVSIGTQIGTIGADDPTRSKYVRGIEVLGNTGVRCANIGLIKPGTLADVRDGLISNVDYSHNTMIDLAGAKFDKAFSLIAGRGAWIRHITGRNNLVLARFLSSGARARVGGVWVNTQDHGGSQPKITDIDIEVEFRDPYDGVANGVGGAPAYPADVFGLVEGSSAGYGDIERIRISGKAHYLARAGVVVGEGFNGAVTIDDLEMNDVNVEGSGSYFGIDAYSVVNIGTNIKMEMLASLPYRQRATGGFVSAQRVTFSVNDIPAGTAGTRALGTLPQRGVIANWGVMGDAIALDATNSLTIQLKRYDKSGATLSAAIAEWSTTTGGRPVVALAHTPLNPATDILTSNNLFEQEDSVVIEKFVNGTGAALTNARFTADVLPY